MIIEQAKDNPKIEEYPIAVWENTAKNYHRNDNLVLEYIVPAAIAFKDSGYMASFIARMFDADINLSGITYFVECHGESF